MTIQIAILVSALIAGIIVFVRATTRPQHGEPDSVSPDTRALFRLAMTAMALVNLPVWANALGLSRSYSIAPCLPLFITFTVIGFRAWKQDRDFAKHS